MRVNWRLRWNYFHDTQFRKSSGVGVVVLVALSAAIGLYDLAVAQFLGDPDRWPRAYDIISDLSWQGWFAIVASVAAVLIFEGGYRVTRDLIGEVSLAKLRYETWTAHLKPIIQTFDPDHQTVNGKPVIGTLRFRIKNVGEDMAYDVHWNVEFYATPGELLTTIVSDSKLDIPPGEYGYHTLTSLHSEWGRILALLKANTKANTPGIRYSLTVRYLHEPRDTQWFQSVHKGKAEFMVSGTPPQMVGWVWVMDGGYSLDRPAEDPLLSTVS